MRRLGILLIVLTLCLGGCTSGASQSPETTNRGNPAEGKAKAEPSLGDTPPDIDLRPWWKRRVDDLLGRKPFSIQIRLAGEVIYSAGAHNDRVPASVQKLALSMALFEELGPNATFPTLLAARARNKSAVEGDLWIIGSGDPTVAGNPHFLATMPRGATGIQELVRALRDAGISEIRGDVMASTGPFGRDWYAPGWKPYFPSSQVGLPTALTFNGNINNERYTKNPERHLAESLRNRLRRTGIVVTGSAGAGPAPRKLRPIASIASPRLAVLARFMHRQSSNFFAEILGKRLGAERFGAPGTIAKGARAISSFARRHGVTIESFDASGLSYDNRVSAAELVSLIEAAEQEPWVDVLRRGLARGGEGTLENRLRNVRVRAKTGTLIDVSTLAGWMWLTKEAQWAEFAIMSRGIEKSLATQIEDKILRTLYNSAGTSRV